jgi:hypothetical protein
MLSQLEFTSRRRPARSLPRFHVLDKSDAVVRTLRSVRKPSLVEPFIVVAVERLLTAYEIDLAIGARSIEIRREIEVVGPAVDAAAIWIRVKAPTWRREVIFELSLLVARPILVCVLHNLQ